MEIFKSRQVIHQKPTGKIKYPYALSSVFFETDQLFLSSELVKPNTKASAPHFHSDIDEIIYVVSGELIAHEGEEQVSLSAGDSICFLANSKINHFIENQSDQDAVFLIFRKNDANDVQY